MLGDGKNKMGKPPQEVNQVLFTMRNIIDLLIYLNLVTLKSMAAESQLNLT